MVTVLEVHHLIIPVVIIVRLRVQKLVVWPAHMGFNDIRLPAVNFAIYILIVLIIVVFSIRAKKLLVDIFGRRGYPPLESCGRANGES